MSSTQIITTADIELVPHLLSQQHQYNDTSKILSETDNGFQGTETQELKPVDRGRDAWTVLIAGFVFDALFWGFPMCFGVFQNYYSQLPEFQKDKAKIPTIGVLAQGLYYLGAPFSAMVTRRYPKYQRLQIWIGCPMCILGLLIASFTNSVSGLSATQGLLYGLGFVTFSFPIVSMINEWWVARKGMAFGLISASSGVTGVAMPFILDALLMRYGHRTTLRASAVAMAVLSAPLLPLFKARLPASDQAVLAPINWGFLKQPLFWVYGSAVLVQNMGFFYPVVFLPSYATELGIPSIQGAILVALMSVAQVLGQFAFGYLSDKNISPSLLGSICCIAAAAAAFTFWGLAKSLPFLIVFSLIYGFFGFGFGTMRVCMGRAVSDDPSTVFATYAIFVFLQGIGNILVGPLSAVMMSSKVNVRHKYAVGKYDSIVILTGVTSCAGAMIMLLWHAYKALTAKSPRRP